MGWAQYADYSSDPPVTSTSETMDLCLQIPGLDLEEESSCEFTWLEPTSQHDQSDCTCMFKNAEGLTFHGSQNFFNISGDYNLHVYECSRAAVSPSDMDKHLPDKEAQNLNEALVFELPQNLSTPPNPIQSSKDHWHFFNFFAFISIFLNRNQKMDRAGASSSLERLATEIEDQKRLIARIHAQETRFIQVEVIIQQALLLWLAVVLFSFCGALMIRCWKPSQDLPSQTLLIPLAFEPLGSAMRGSHVCKLPAEEKRLRSLEEERDAILNEINQTSKFNVNYSSHYGD